MKTLALIALSGLVAAGLLAGCAGGEDRPDDADYVDSMAVQHADDEPAATAFVREPRMPVETREVTYMSDGASVTGYYAEPVRPDSVARARGRASAAQLPGLIVIHEWWGLNDNIEGVTRRLAGEGYRALAVDLYRGQVADAPEAARNLMERALQDEAAAAANLRAAYDHLSQNNSAPVGVIGWCFGGSMAYKAAQMLPEGLGAAVIYYGQVSSDGEAVDQVSVPVLGIFGGQDRSIPVEDVRAFEQAMQDAGKDVEVHVYDGAGHAFANPSGQNFVEEAARQAWDQTTAFLREHLYPDAAATPPQ